MFDNLESTFQSQPHCGRDRTDSNLLGNDGFERNPDEPPRRYQGKIMISGQAEGLSSSATLDLRTDRALGQGANVSEFEIRTAEASRSLVIQRLGLSDQFVVEKSSVFRNDKD